MKWRQTKIIGRHHSLQPVVRKLYLITLKSTLNEWHVEQLFFLFWLHLDCQSFKSYMFLSYMFTKFLCLFCTEIDIPTLKYLARYKGLSSTFYCIMQPQFSYCMICEVWYVGLACFLAGTCRPYSLLKFI